MIFVLFCFVVENKSKTERRKVPGRRDFSSLLFVSCASFFDSGAVGLLCLRWCREHKFSLLVSDDEHSWVHCLLWKRDCQCLKAGSHGMKSCHLSW